MSIAKPTAVLAALFAAVFTCPVRALAESDRPFGIEARVPWSVGHVTGTPEPPPPYQTERVFPKLTFNNPVEVAFAPGSSRVFVVEQHAKIYSFPDDPACTKADLFADLPNEVQHLDKVPDCRGVDQSFGIAFHPQFAKNHFVYIFYLLADRDQSKNLPNGTRVSRFTVTQTDPPHIDPASEVVMLEWRGGGHNGGSLKFGPDGYLYASAGDSGDPNPPDPFNTGQDISDLMSSVLRIDVDHQAPGKTYAIPADNPFIHTPGARPEVWAYGLRNPWRMNFDRQTGNLWVGDVGWELWESVVCAKSGGNYGWSIMEGPNPVHPDGKRGPTPLIPPVIALPHTEAASLTGGTVYRGTRLPELTGSYIFGDWMVQRLWAAPCIGEHADKLAPYRIIAETGQKIVAFGEQPDGELLIVDHGGGGLWRIVHNDVSAQAQAFPRKLSETGLFTSTRDQTPQPGVIAFSINAPQWVDGAVGQRWVAVPGNGRVVWGQGPFGEDKPVWPKDSVLVRTLSFDAAGGAVPGAQGRAPVETQLLHYDGRQWRGYSYAWNDDKTDAELVDAAGDVRMVAIPDPAAPGGMRRQRWHFGSRAQCITCHNTWCDYCLAFNAKQLDRSQQFSSNTDNEVRTFRHIGLLLAPKPPDPSSPPAFNDNQTLTDPYDPSGNLYERARSYLDVNCSHCHRFGAGGSALFDARKELLLPKTNLVNVSPNLGAFGISDARLLCAGDPCRSVLLYRMAKLGPERMPHIGSDVVDDKGVELIRQWTASLGKSTEPSHAADLRIVEDQTTSPPIATAAIDRLLGSTDGALALVCEVQAGRVPAPISDIAKQRGMASEQGLVHDLYRRFDPADQAIDRLGPNIDPAKILSLTGDAARGRKIFFEQNGGLCARCHKVASQGTDFGPDLTQIAARYNRADLLDNIINPSKTIAPGFVTYFVKTKSGDVYTGLLVSKTDHEVVLKDATLKPIHVDASRIDRFVPQAISAMPEGLLGDLDAQQAADLIAFLEAKRP